MAAGHFAPAFWTNVLSGREFDGGFRATLMSTLGLESCFAFAAIRSEGRTTRATRHLTSDVYSKGETPFLAWLAFVARRA